MKYYLINNKIMKGGEMPEQNGYPDFEQLTSKWLSSLQPCEIDESELKKIKEYLIIYIGEPPIEITDIVEEKDGKIYFKQPKQVESEFYCHDELVRNAAEDYEIPKCAKQCDKCKNEFPEHPKQVDVEIEAVEFAEWMYENRYVKYFGNDSMNCDKWYKQYTPPNREYYTTKQLYEIFKNR